MEEIAVTAMSVVSCQLSVDKATCCEGSLPGLLTTTNEQLTTDN